MTDNDPQIREHRSWLRKFAYAGRGLKLGIRGQSSFFVHLFVAALVITAGVALQIDRLDWCLVILCIVAVLTAETFNSAIERLAEALHPDEHPGIGDALDIASGAVLVTSLGSAVVGVVVLLPKIW